MTQIRWTRLTEWPLTAAALMFLAAYSWQVIGAPTGTAGDIAEITIWFTWATFVVDYLVNLVLSRQRWRWFYTHLFDLVIVALPILRPVRNEASAVRLSARSTWISPKMTLSSFGSPSVSILICGSI